jgi:hypothetical protein
MRGARQDGRSLQQLLEGPIATAAADEDRPVVRRPDDLATQHRLPGKAPEALPHRCLERVAELVTRGRTTAWWLLRLTRLSRRTCRLGAVRALTRPLRPRSPPGGGRLIARGGKLAVLEGDAAEAAGRFGVRGPEAAKRWYASPKACDRRGRRMRSAAADARWCPASPDHRELLREGTGEHDLAPPSLP